MGVGKSVLTLVCVGVYDFGCFLLPLPLPKRFQILHLAVTLFSYYLLCALDMPPGKLKPLSASSSTTLLFLYINASNPCMI